MQVEIIWIRLHSIIFIWKEKQDGWMRNIEVSTNILGVWGREITITDRIRSNSLFTGHNLRKGVNDGMDLYLSITQWYLFIEGSVDFNSCFLSEVPLLFRRKAIPLNASIIQVSTPDQVRNPIWMIIDLYHITIIIQNGYCSLGTSVDTARAAVTNSNHIIAMTNKNMPSE